MSAQEVRTPKFCAVCGTQLIASSVVLGYDAFTGDPVAQRRLDCPNPTTVSSAYAGLRLRTTTVDHPSWSATTDGVWSQGA